jgi:hypothetical protein
MKRPETRLRAAVSGLPPLTEVLRGSVVVRFLRCGKAGCHCVEDEGHRATYLSVTLSGGRTEQISLPPDLVSIALRQVANYHAWWKAIEEVSAINRELLRALRKKRAPRDRPGRSRPGARHRPSSRRRR